MNGWLVATVVVAPALLPCAVVCVRGSRLEAVVALQVAGVIAVVVMLLLTEGLHRPAFADLALVLAPISFAGSLAFIRLVAGGPS